MSAQMLFVEDNTDLREVLTHTSRRAGYQVTPTASGGEAMELLATVAPGRPQLNVVLSDIALGDRGEIDGTEVMAVARRRPDPPEVILLTGHAKLFPPKSLVPLIAPASDLAFRTASTALIVADTVTRWHS